MASRRDWTPTSPLYLLEGVRIHENMGILGNAADFLVQARLRPEVADPAGRLDLQIVAARAVEEMGMSHRHGPSSSDPRRRWHADPLPLSGSTSRSKRRPGSRPTSRAGPRARAARRSGRLLSDRGIWPSSPMRPGGRCGGSTISHTEQAVRIIGADRPAPPCRNGSGALSSGPIPKDFVRARDGAGLHPCHPRCSALAVRGTGREVAQILRGRDFADNRRSAATRVAGERHEQSVRQARIHGAFADAFDWDDLHGLALSAFGVHLSNITLTKSLNEAIRELIGWAEAHADLERLVEAACKAWPDNPTLQQLE